MKINEVFSLIYSDYRRYRATGGDSTGSLLGVLLLSQGFWASVVYRLSHAVLKIKPSFIRGLLRILFLFIEKWIEIITGIRIPGGCKIGEGLYIGHFGNIILNSKAVIGKNCNLSQNVTIGIVQSGERKGVPQIGDRVYIGPNAVVIGNIQIGNDVAIGAGAIVTRSCEDRDVLAGNPAKIISHDGSFGMINYDGMLQDPERISSLRLGENS